MSRKQLFNNLVSTCSYGIHWSYGGSGETNNGTFNVSVINIMLKQTGFCMGSSQDLFVLQLHQFSVYIVKKNSDFTNLRASLIKLDVASLSQSSIEFYKCNFSLNTVSYVIYFQYQLPPVDVNNIPTPKIDVKFVNTTFSSNTYHSAYLHNSSILRLVISSHIQVNLNVDFVYVLFYKNEVTLLSIYSSTSLLGHQPAVSISTTGYFVAKQNQNFACDNNLISIMEGQVHFNGITEFTNNQVTEILHSSSSLIIFSNITLFATNICKHLVSLNCRQCYIIF